MNTSTIHERATAGARATWYARTLATAATVLLVPGALAACGDDDPPLGAASCDAYAALQQAFFGDPAALPGAFDAFASSVPDDLADDAATLADAAAAATDDPDAFASPEANAAFRAIGDAAFDGCDATTTLDVSGEDFAFVDLPGSVRSGRLLLRLTNDSADGHAHEIVIAQGVDGEDASELADLPVGELMMRARPIGVTFAENVGDRATTIVDLEPGSYLMICTLPVDESAPDGPTHADQGMVTTLEVTE